MRTTEMFLFTITWFLQVGVSNVYAAEALDEEPQRGAIIRGKVLVCSHSDKTLMKAFVVSLSDGTIRAELIGAFAKENPVRWQIGHGYFWPTDHFFITEPNKVRVGLCHYQLDGLLAGKRITVRGGTENDERESLAVSRLLDSIRTHGAWSTNYRAFLQYDYLPVSEDQVQLFVITNVALSLRNRTGPGGAVEKQEFVLSREDALTPRWTFTVYQTRRIYMPENKHWKEDAYIPIERFPVTFREPFQVLSQGKNYYFITASGKLYRTGARRFLTNQREIDPVWSDETHPITHFLTDADADRTFLFCKPAKEGEPGVYFELGPKSEPKPYDLSKVKPSKADEPLKGVIERARFLADQKLLKNPDPPKDEKKP